MRIRYLCSLLLTAAVASPALSAPAKTKPSAKKPAIVKPPPAPPRGKATFPKQTRRRPAGKIIKILPGEKHLDPKALVAAPTATQIANKRRANAIVKPPLKPKKPVTAVKAAR